MDSQSRQAIFSAVDSLRDELAQTVSAMVQCKSVSPVFGWEAESCAGGENAAGKIAQAVMLGMGLQPQLAGPDSKRQNVCTRYPGTGGKSLLFNGHMDVVPPGDPEQWKGIDPFGGKISDGYIYGRGAVDMKGGITAALFALKAILNAGYRPKGDVVYHFAVGEECRETEIGTGACLENGYLADAAVVCEPTCTPSGAFEVNPASAGVFEMSWTVKGKGCHAGARREVIRDGGAGEAVGVDAIEKGLVIYHALRDLERRWGQTKTHPMFAAGSFCLNAATIKAGVGPSMVAPDMTVSYGVFYSPSDEAESVKREIEECARNACLNDPWLRKNPPEFTWAFNWPAFDTPADDPFIGTLRSAVREVCPDAGDIRAFFAVSDASFIRPYGIPVAVLGPGETRLAHTADEKVAVSRLVEAAKIYALAIANWCGLGQKGE